MSQNELSQWIKAPVNRIHAIANGQRRITVDTDLRLCKFFDLSDGYFLGLQNDHETVEVKRKLSEIIADITPYKSKEKTLLLKTK